VRWYRWRLAGGSTRPEAGAMIAYQQVPAKVSGRQEISSRCTVFQALLRKVWFSLSAFSTRRRTFFNLTRARTSSSA
jgi:hypothetical protein